MGVKNSLCFTIELTSHSIFPSTALSNSLHFFLHVHIALDNLVLFSSIALQHTWS